MRYLSEGGAMIAWTSLQVPNPAHSSSLIMTNKPEKQQQQEQHQGLKLSRRRSTLGLLIALNLWATSSSSSSAAAGDEATEMCTEFKTVASGLGYCDMVRGKGKPPVKGNVIKLHYTGSMESNGEVFDSSHRRGEPLSFQLNSTGVMKGVYEAILGSDDLPPMRPGGRRRVRIPAELGFGNNAGMCPRFWSGPCQVPPNSVLVYDLQYLGLWTSDEDTRPFHLFT